MSCRSLASLLTLLATLLLAAVRSAPADAAVTFYRWFKTATYLQTSNAQPVGPHYFGDVDVIFDNPLDLTGGTVTSSTRRAPPLPATNRASRFLRDSTSIFRTAAPIRITFPAACSAISRHHSRRRPATYFPRPFHTSRERVTTICRG